jgi:hypothetical protein
MKGEIITSGISVEVNSFKASFLKVGFDFFSLPINNLIPNPSHIIRTMKSNLNFII